jgi:hypothetical protein
MAIFSPLDSLASCLSAEVYADPRVDRLRRLHHLDRHVDVPTATGILRARAATDLGVLGQQTVQPNVVPLAATNARSLNLKAC